MAELVNVTIDDIKVQVPAGTLVVDAAEAAGIEIPIFCSHPKLDPLGACRMCLVEFPGPRGSRLDTACTVRVSEGMAVRTDTDQVKAVREANLAFILLNHPLDCPICDKGGECPLQDQTMEYGPGVSQFVEAKRRKQKHYPISDLIMLDQERCILCWRCIRYLDEWEDKPQLGLFERGGETLIDIFPDRPVDAKTSGSIIDICPVGALTNRVARFRYRPWELRKTASVCTLCPVGCNLRLDERVHELRRIVARENLAVNDEWICDKGRFLHQYVDHPERLTTPMIREGETLRPASWDEALARVVDGFEAIAEQSGPAAVGGIASASVSNEAAYLFQKFFRVLVGTNNVDHRDGSAVRAQPTGLSAITDVTKSDLIVLVGIDPSEQVPVLDLHIKRAVVRNGARLLIVNSRASEPGRYVGDPRTKGAAFLPAAPGEEARVLAEIAGALPAPNQGSRQGIAGAARVVAGKAASAVTGRLSGQAIRPEIQAAVELLSGAKSPLFIYGPEAARGVQGRLTVTALTNLAVLLGHGDKVAFIGIESNEQGVRDAGLLSDALPGHSSVGDAAVRERLGKLWGVPPPAEPGLSYHGMLEGGVKGLYVMAEDPARMAGNVRALEGLGFLVVQDMFLTETARLADVVLPSASFAEADHTYTNLERRVQRAPKGIESIEGCKADWAILGALGEKWVAAQVAEATPAGAGAPPEWKRKKRARVKAGPGPKPWHYTDVRTILEEIGKANPAYAGLHWETLDDQGAQWPANAVSRAVRRVEPLDIGPQSGLEAGQLLLASGPVLWDASVLMQHAADQVKARIPEPFAAINPITLAANGLSDGIFSEISSARGAARLLVRADETVAPGVAWVPYGLTGLPAETLGAGRGEVVVVTIK
jgi:NADH-quinone oxidoreductase subunit G